MLRHQSSEWQLPAKSHHYINARANLDELRVRAGSGLGMCTRDFMELSEGFENKARCGENIALLH